MIQTCKADYAYFLRNFVYIESAVEGAWIRFAPWPAQLRVLRELHDNRQVVILKARQLGLTWLILALVLAEIMFGPLTIALFFSQGEREAKELLGRLKGMYSRLPAWMKDGNPTIDNSEEWRLPNGSRALSFASTGGRSFTGSIVVMDEADFIERFNEAMNAVKPTIDAGGKLFLISTVDKAKQESPFKRIYRGAKGKLTKWHPIFLPWHARPDRDAAWYEEQKADILARTGFVDGLWQEYPATDSEALAPNTADKRISPAWLEACYAPMSPLNHPKGAPALPNLEVYKLPASGRRYVIGADPAEGNPNSDDSALTVVDLLTGEEVAALAGKVEPATFGSYLKSVSAYYHNAPALVERNNHGHTVILWLADNARRVRLLHGHDWDADEHAKDEKRGWHTTTLSKALMYTEATEHFRQNASLDEPRNNVKVLHSERSYYQLGSIEGATLSAPKGMSDDRATSYALAQVGRIEAATNRQVPMARGKVKGWGAKP